MNEELFSFQHFSQVWLKLLLSFDKRSAAEALKGLKDNYLYAF